MSVFVLVVELFLIAILFIMQLTHENEVEAVIEQLVQRISDLETAQTQVKPTEKTLLKG